MLCNCEFMKNIEYYKLCWAISYKYQIRSNQGSPNNKSRKSLSTCSVFINCTIVKLGKTFYGRAVVKIKTFGKDASMHV